MILTQYYLGCLAHASYLVADEAEQDRGDRRPAARRRPVPRGRRGHGHHRSATCSSRTFTPTSSPGTSSCATASAPTIASGRRRRPSTTSGRLPRRRRRSTSAPGAPRGARDAGPLAGVDLDPRLRPPSTREQPVRGAHRRHAVHRRRRPARPAGRRSAGRPRTSARLLYDSIHEKLLPLPDETLVYPAHGAGSLCGKNLSTDTVSTIGVQRQYNYALQPMTKDEFVRIVTADQPDSPAYFTYDAVLNTKERPTLEATLERELKPLGSGRRHRAEQSRARQVLDTRDPADFAGAHLAGASTSASAGATRRGAGRCSTPLGRS